MATGSDNLTEGGWHSYGEKTHYPALVSGGTAYNGWIYAGSWYYCENARAAAFCEKTIGGEINRFDAEGRMITGWYWGEKGKQYFRPDGSRCTSCSYEIDGWMYCFDENGCVIY